MNLKEQIEVDLTAARGLINDALSQRRDLTTAEQSTLVEKQAQTGRCRSRVWRTSSYTAATAARTTTSSRSSSRARMGANGIPALRAATQNPTLISPGMDEAIVSR